MQYIFCMYSTLQYTCTTILSKKKSTTKYHSETLEKICLKNWRVISPRCLLNLDFCQRGSCHGLSISTPKANILPERNVVFQASFFSGAYTCQFLENVVYVHHVHHHHHHHQQQQQHHQQQHHQQQHHHIIYYIFVFSLQTNIWPSDIETTPNPFFGNQKKSLLSRWLHLAAFPGSGVRIRPGFQVNLVYWRMVDLVIQRSISSRIDFYVISRVFHEFI